MASYQTAARNLVDPSNFDANGQQKQSLRDSKSKTKKQRIPLRGTYDSRKIIVSGPLRLHQGCRTISKTFAGSAIFGLIAKFIEMRRLLSKYKEETFGANPGGPVVTTGAPLSAELGTRLHLSDA